MSTEDLKMQQLDIDPQETQEWMESFDSIVEHQGIERAYFILTQLLSRAQIERVELPALLQTPYINTIPPEREPGYPGDEDLERKIRRYIRWNAAVMVVKANKNFSESVGTFQRTLRLRRCWRLALIMFSAEKIVDWVTRCSSKDTRRRESTRAPFWKAGYRLIRCSISDVRLSRGRGCQAIHTRG